MNRPRPMRDWTLRSRIVAAVLGLLVTLCLLIGLFTEISLRHFLVGRLDQQLTSTAGRLSTFPPPAQFQPSSRNNALRAPVDGSVFALFPAAGTASGTLSENGSDAALDSGSLSVLQSAPAVSQPHSVSLPGHGNYRVSARLMSDGTEFVTGLPLKPVSDTITQLILIITALSLAGLLIASLAGALIVRAALRPLNRVTATASRVADLPLNEGEVALAERVPNPNPHTEVGQVGVALNRMLENVHEALNARHRSETRVRQFVADASHELRTPLAAIRGYAELTRRSRDTAPPDITHAMGRIESEAVRMTTLVEDLLLLARLDAGRPLEALEVDLTRLTLDVLSDAHAAGLDHQWHLKVADEPVLVTGDEARLHQVLGNLLANARTHTPAGSNVWVTLGTVADSAVFTVADDGPGIAPEQLGEVFERFSRGEQSRSRGAGSTGLGLAIVSAVTQAHGGSIAVTSRPGQTIFTVTLPVATAPTAAVSTMPRRTLPLTASPLTAMPGSTPDTLPPSRNLTESRKLDPEVFIP